MNPAYSDPELLQWTLDLSKKFNIRTFFETGTYHGKSAIIVSRYFDNVITVETNPEFYKIASNNISISGVKNCKLLFGSSPKIMEEQLINHDNSTFFFLDAHWEENFPLLDELDVIKRKNQKPVIAIHDFYVPDNNGNAKFGFDVCGNKMLNFNYIKDSIRNIYGDDFEIKYSTTSTVNSGVIYIYPSK